MGRVKQWYVHTVRSVIGDWDELREKFCLAFFPISRIITLRLEILTFQQKEKETLGAAWARFSSLITSGLDLSMPDHVLLQHFHYGLSKEAALFLDISSGGSYSLKTVSEGKAIQDKILENTPYTSVYDEFLKKKSSQALNQKRRHVQLNWKFQLILLMIWLLKNLPIRERKTN